MSAPSTNTQSAPGNQSQNNPNGVHSTPGLPEGLNINNISDVTSLPPEQLAALIQSLPGIANIPGLVQKVSFISIVEHATPYRFEHTFSLSSLWSASRVNERVLYT